MLEEVQRYKPRLSFSRLFASQRPFGSHRSEWPFVFSYLAQGIAFSILPQIFRNIRPRGPPKGYIYSGLFADVVFSANDEAPLSWTLAHCMHLRVSGGTVCISAFGSEEVDSFGGI